MKFLGRVYTNTEIRKKGNFGGNNLTNFLFPYIYCSEDVHMKAPWE